MDAGIDKVVNVSTDWQSDKDLHECMTHLYERQLWTDVIFHCNSCYGEGGDNTIRAHKVILAARSVVFHAMFFGPNKEAVGESVNIPDTDKETFDIFLRYLYTDQVQLSEPKVVQVMEIAHMYQVQTLVNLCIKFLGCIIRTDNACSILQLALFYDLDSLKDKAVGFIDDYASEILESDEFTSISKECLIYLIKGDTFLADEADILKGVIKWLRLKKQNDSRVDDKEIQATLAEISVHLRDQSMKTETIFEHLKQVKFEKLEGIGVSSDTTDSKEKNNTETHPIRKRLPRCEKVMINNYGPRQSIQSFESSYKIYVASDIYLHSFVFDGLSVVNKYGYAEQKAYLVSCETKRLVDVLGRNEDSIKTFLRQNSTRYGRSCVLLFNGYNLNAYYCDITDGQYELQKKFDVEVTCCVSVKELDYMYTFETSHNNINGGQMPLNTPLLLKRSEDPYHLEINIKCRGLPFCINGMTINYPKEARNTDNTVRIEYGKESRRDDNVYYNVLRSITFQNVSTRK